MTIVMQPNFVKKVVFPSMSCLWRVSEPRIFHFLISAHAGRARSGVVRTGLTWSSLWLPLIVLPVVLISVGLAWLISSLGVFFRDIGQATQFLSQVLMFASAVFYPPSMLPPAAWQFLRFNPILLAIELARTPCSGISPSTNAILVFLYVSGLAVFILGRTVFTRLKPAFADVLIAMSSDPIISVCNVSKAYRIWESPAARLASSCWQSLAGLAAKKHGSPRQTVRPGKTDVIGILRVA